MSRWHGYLRSLPWRLSFAVPMAVGGYFAVVGTTPSPPRDGMIFAGVLAFVCLWPRPRNRKPATHPMTNTDGDGDAGGGDGGGDGGD
jgi:hypothetical protein